MNGSRSDKGLANQMKIINKSKNALDKLPILKQASRLVLGGVLKRRKQRRISRYNKWLRTTETQEDNSFANQALEAERLPYRPLISIITPTYNTPEIFFREMVESVINQSYTQWELVLVDDASPAKKTRDLILEYSKKDQRIRSIFLEKNHHIANATNEGIKVAKGEFISLLDHDDILQPNALLEIAKALNKNRHLNLLYTDEDKISESKREHKDPLLKPDWNPDFLRSVNYITHFTTIRKSVLDRLGYEDADYNGAQDWELFLRITRQISPESICHIPEVLYSWRIHDESTAKTYLTKPYVIDSQKKALQSDLQARGHVNAIIRQDQVYPGQWGVKFKTSINEKVTIVITGGNARKTIRDIETHTNYSNYEIISEYISTIDLLSRITGKYVVFVSETLHIQTPGWVEEMIGDAGREDIGFVAVRHSTSRGVVKNIESIMDPRIAIFVKTLQNKDLTKHLYSTTRYNLPYLEYAVAVMIEASKLQAILKNSRDEVNIREYSETAAHHGYKNLYNPYIEMVK